MEPDNSWNEPMDDDGVTLGPEAALQREIQKSKQLKVERLQLQDRLETLKTENAALIQENEKLKAQAETRGPAPANAAGPHAPGPRPRVFAWTLFLLILNIVTLSVLLYFLLLK